MILEGHAPPPAWRPLIRSLDFAGTSLADLSPLAGLASLSSLDLRDTKVTDVPEVMVRRLGDGLLR
jgi:Leucine-rich repeat (LRR) protein